MVRMSAIITPLSQTQKTVARDVEAMLQLKNGSSDILDKIDLRQAEEFFLHNNFRVSNADTKTFVLMIPEVTTLAALSDFLGGCASPCRLLHFRSHFIAFPRHVQFGEYIKGGSRLFPLRLAITLFAREQAPKPNSSKPGCSGCLLSALSSIRSIAANSRSTPKIVQICSSRARQF
jgi:hypothetical protein